MENTIAVPTTLPEVEHLIAELYKPNLPEVISRIQEALQCLQKSPQGWQLAQSLLARPGDNNKFFGALTINVKLNTERLPDETALSVLENLILWLLHSLSDGSGPVVIRKLCSALATYYLQYSNTWARCIRHLILCLDRNATVSIEELDESVPLNQIIEKFDAPKFMAATCFAAFLAEEMNKVDTKTTKYIALHERVVDNGDDVGVLMTGALSPRTEDASHLVQKEAIHCLQAWLMYAQRTTKKPLFQMLQALFQPMLSCLVVDELFESTVELLIDTLCNWQQFFTRGHIDSLYALFESQWARDRYQGLIGGDFDFDSVQFGLFMLAFGDAQMVEMMDTSDTRAQALLAALAGLLTAEGYPVAEDRIFVPAIEFWCSYVENLTDTVYLDKEKHSLPWHSPPLSQVMLVVSQSWVRIRYPPPDVYNTWDSTEKVAFSDARKDYADFLQSVYTLAEMPLLTHFVDIIPTTLASLSWAELEAACFCLGALAESCPAGGSYDNELTKVFGSVLFDMLREKQSDVPVRVRQTCLSLIEHYSSYFLRHPQYLPSALNLLFSAVSERHLALTASKSIANLCATCRGLLNSEVHAFLEQYGVLRNLPGLDSLAEERVVGAIAKIIYSIPSMEQKLSYYQRLLTIVGLDVTASLQLKSMSADALIDENDPIISRAWDLSQRPTSPVLAHEAAFNLAVRALRCLNCIARGSQLPEWDNDTEDDTPNGSPPKGTAEDFKHIQADIYGILVQLKDAFSNHAEVVDVICAILRAGIAEGDPGPFVFSPAVMTEFFVSDWQSRVTAVVNTANAFARRVLFIMARQDAHPFLERLVPWVFGLLHQLPNPEADPELSQYGIEFAHILMRKHARWLASRDPGVLNFILNFAMALLDGNEPLPKSAAVDFWVTFIFEATSITADDPSPFKEVIVYVGPRLAQSLMFQIGGRASRSELDKLSDPVRHLVSKHVHASRWIQTALDSPEFPSDKVSSQDKTLFVKKIVSLRGSMPTNQVVREFWLASRGSNFAYAS